MSKKPPTGKPSAGPALAATVDAPQGCSDRKTRSFMETQQHKVYCTDQEMDMLAFFRAAPEEDKEFVISYALLRASKVTPRGPLTPPKGDATMHVIYRAPVNAFTRTSDFDREVLSDVAINRDEAQQQERTPHLRLVGSTANEEVGHV